MRAINFKTIIAPKREKSGTPTTSWWLGLEPEQFYKEARERFPDSDHSPVVVFGSNGPRMSVRKSNVRRAARRKKRGE